MDSAGSSIIIQIGLLVVLLMFSAFFSSSETALMSLNKIRLRHMQEENIKGANLLAKLIEDSGNLLSTILIGNNIVNIAATSISTSIFITLLKANGVAIATVVMTILILIIGEIIPKTIAANHSEKVAMIVCRPIRLIIKFLSPIVWVFNLATNFIFMILKIEKKSDQPSITEEELKTMVNVSHEEGVIEIEKREMINNVFQFGDMQANEAMIQRIDIICVSADDNYEEIVSTFKKEQFTRMPVYDQTIDNIIGIVNIKDIIFLNEDEIKSFDIKKHIREAFFTYEFKKITQLLEEMKKDKVQMAIIVDEYGGTAGLITIEDLIEQIVGNIEDEYDEYEEDIQKLSENEYIVQGNTKISDVSELIGIHLENDEVDSIGGYIIGYLKRFPEENEVIQIDNIKISIESLDKNRIKKIKIYKVDS